jgi:hypothetical protein
VLTQTHSALMSQEASPDLNAVLWAAVEVAIEQLHQFVANQAGMTSLHTAFGQGWDLEVAESLLKSLTSFDNPANPLTRIAVLPGQMMQARGAYAATTQTIYLSAEFLTQNACSTPKDRGCAVGGAGAPHRYPTQQRR